MSANAEQNYKKHTRLDPLFHFFLLPVAAANVIVAIWKLVEHPNLTSGWLVILAIAGVVAVSKIRTYALKAQDRVIRMEERMRLAQLLPAQQRGRISELTEPQLIALRFACDGEIPSLVEKALAGNMRARDIKQGIVTWRPDYFRV
jgi:hypothetical protein